MKKPRRVKLGRCHPGLFLIKVEGGSYVLGMKTEYSDIYEPDKIHPYTRVLPETYTVKAGEAFATRYRNPDVMVYPVDTDMVLELIMSAMFEEV